MAYDYIEQNLLNLRNKIARISTECNRDPKEIYLVAVSKTFQPEMIESAMDHDQLDFGENRVQELVDKQKALKDRIINWHLVGHLQTNKVKYIVPFIYLIHSLDSFKLALKVNQEASKIKRKIKCLIQVNTSGEMQKSGCELNETIRLVKEISSLDNIRLCGLMTIAKILPDNPTDEEYSVVRQNFRSLKELYDEIIYMNIPNVQFQYLSMGMSSDYEIAIEEGANMIRIGTSIFGQRTTNNF